MGSCKTNVKQLFQGPMPKMRQRPFTVRVTVDNVFTKFTRFSFDLYIHQELSIEAANEKSTPDYVWNVARSTARDFEVVTSPIRKILAQGQVIGTIIIECMHAYVKIFWQDFENWTPTNQVDLLFTQWGHDPDAEKVLANDLTTGHHVLYMAGKDGKSVFYLHEEDDGPRKEAEIFIASLQGKGLENFEKYVAEKQAKAETSDEEDDDPPQKRRKENT